MAGIQADERARLIELLERLESRNTWQVLSEHAQKADEYSERSGRWAEFGDQIESREGDEPTKSGYDLAAKYEAIAEGYRQNCQKTLDEIVEAWRLLNVVAPELRGRFPLQKHTTWDDVKTLDPKTESRRIADVLGHVLAKQPRLLEQDPCAAEVAAETSENDAIAIERMLNAIRDTNDGRHAKRNTLLRTAGGRRQVNLKALNALKERGEYDGPK